MTGTDPSGYVVNLHHPEIMRGVIEQILGTGDLIGRDENGRTILAVAVDDRLFDELAALGSDVEDAEPDPVENDDAMEDDAGR